MIKAAMPFLEREEDEVLKNLRIRLRPAVVYEPSDLSSMFGHNDERPSLEVTRKKSRYILTMNHRLLIEGTSLGKTIVTSEANFITFLEIRLSEKRGWTMDMKISDGAFLDDFKCSATDEQCSFLEAKLPRIIPPLVFPKSYDYFGKPYALQVLLGLLDNITDVLRSAYAHYVWIDEEDTVLAMFQGCSDSQIEEIISNKGAGGPTWDAKEKWSRDEVILSGEANAFGGLIDQAWSGTLSRIVGGVGEQS